MSRFGLSFWLSPRMVIAGWIAVAIVALIWIIPGFEVVTWTGRRTIPVLVRVFDPAAGTPIAGARIEVFDGPFAPVEGRHVRRVEPTQANEVGVTDENGWATVSHEFTAFGSSGQFENITVIYWNRCWVRATVEDGTSVTVPVANAAEWQKGEQRTSHAFVMIGLSPPK